MRTSEETRAVIVRSGLAPDCDRAQLARSAGVSLGTVERWLARSEAGESLHDRPRSGRPSEAAPLRGRLVTELMRAGRAVTGPEYSSRALAQRLGTSQSSLTRAVRALEVDAMGAVVGPTGGPVVELVGVEIDRPTVRFEFAPLSHPADPPGQLARKRQALVAALYGWGVVEWVSRPGRLDRAAPPKAESPVTREVGTGAGRAAEDGASGRGPSEASTVGSAGSALRPLHLRFSLQTQRGQHGVEQGESDFVVIDDRTTYFLSVVGECLARCAHIPAQLCEAIAHASSGRRARLSWASDGAGRVPAAVPRLMNYDSELMVDSGAAALSPVHRVVQALDAEIRDAGLQAGESIRVGRIMRLSGLSRSEVSGAVSWLEDESIVRVVRGSVVLPQVNAVDVLDLYAARRQLGSVILGRLAAARGVEWVELEHALGNVRRVAATQPERVGGADLEFQARWAGLAGLRHTGSAFERISMRLHVFIAMLKMNYASAAARIAFDDTRILAALRAGNGQRAVAAWHDKVDNAVRHMSGSAQHRRFDVTLWRDLIGS